jgi:hypothetical protein
MKPLLIVAAMSALILAAHANAATGASQLQVLDVRIADAKQAATAANKAAHVICGDAGFAMDQHTLGTPNSSHKQFRQCIDAMEAANDAIGRIGYLYEERSRLTGKPMPAEYACDGKPSLGAPHPDVKGHYAVCPKDPDDHSYTFWIITQVRMQVGSAQETWSDSGFISLGRYSSEPACRAAIAKYEDYPSKIPYALQNGAVVGDVCVEVVIPDVRKLPHQ